MRCGWRPEQGSDGPGVVHLGSDAELCFEGLEIDSSVGKVGFAGGGFGLGDVGFDVFDCGPR